MNEIYVINKDTGETTTISNKEFGTGFGSNLDYVNNLYMDKEELDFWYGELEALRDSGTMNMFGAPTWLSENFEDEMGDPLSRKVAKAIFTSWTKTFEGGA